MRVVFLGSGGVGLPALGWLLEAPGIVAAGVVTQPDRPAGRGLKLVAPPVKELAATKGVPVLQPPRIREATALDDVARLKPDLLVVMAYGQILPPALLNLAPLGAINLHASLLPRHRGAAPIHSAILAGDPSSGVTVMWMDEGLDTGDILLARACAIADDETAGSLHDKLADLAPRALAEAMELIRAGTAPRLPQDPSLATYAPKLSRASGTIDWTQDAPTIERLVRAMHPWPGSSVGLITSDGRNVAVKVHRAAAAPDRSAAGEVMGGTLRVGCGGGGAIDLLEVQPAGGRRMPAADFLRGHNVVRVA